MKTAKLKALRRWNHLMLATNASINIFIYVAKVEISYSGQCTHKNMIFFIPTFLTFIFILISKFQHLGSKVPGCLCFNMSSAHPQ